MKQWFTSNKADFMALLKMLPCNPFVDFMKVFEALVDFLTRLTSWLY